MKVAFQGEHGAYSEAALLKHFGTGVEACPYASFELAFAAVAKADVDAAVIPIENSLAGSVLDNYDLLLDYELPIIGEIRLNVRHCLLAKPGIRLEDVKVCYSHPQALAQSASFLKRHGIEPRGSYDTAGAARDLSERDEPHAAAIASALAAQIYGLNILVEGIQTRDDNTTRFFVIARKRPQHLPAEKASLVFATANRPGALYGSLGVFARRGLNLTKIESRPTRHSPWEYHFYLDVEGHDLAHARDALLQELLEHAEFVRLLGAYPRAID